VSCDRACPGFESARRFEARMGPVNAPKGLHGQILGRGRIAHDAQQPAVDSALVEAEKGFEGIVECSGGASLKLVRKTLVSIASAAPNLPDYVRSVCDLYHKIISSRGV